MFTFLRRKAEGSMTPLNLLAQAGRVRSVPAAELIAHLRAECADRKAAA